MLPAKLRSFAEGEMIKSNLKKIYRQQISDLMRIVNKFDPFGLITAAECPEDEYSPEISDILVGLKNCSNGQDVSKLVAQIFNDAFSSNQAREDYREIVEEIWEWWQKQQTQYTRYERDHAFLEFEAWKNDSTGDKDN
jgi:hypothetical protein